MIEDFKPRAKQAKIRPSSTISPHIREIVSQLRCYVWQYEATGDEAKEEQIWGKPARSPMRTGRKIRWGGEHFEKDEHLWGDFHSAWIAYLLNPYPLDGIGFLVEPDRPIEVEGEDQLPVWLDLDDCRNPETGQIDHRVMEEIEQLNTYTEISPSGKGLRCLGLGKRHPGSRTFFDIDGHNVEIYGGGVGGRHLITYTGVALEGYDRPVRNIQNWVDLTVPVKTSSKKSDGSALNPEPVHASDEELIAMLKRSRRGDLFERLWEGEARLWGGEDAVYGSPSEADLALAGMLAFATGRDEERMMRMLRASGLNREKWDEHPTYLEDTVKVAVRNCTKVYNPKDLQNSEQHPKNELLEGCLKLWMGIKDPKVRGAFGSLLVYARKYGMYCRQGHVEEAHGKRHIVPEEGVLVYAALRDLGILMGEGDVSEISKSMKKMREGGLGVRLSKGKGFWGSLYLLPTTLVAPIDSGLQHKKHNGGTQCGGGLFTTPYCVSTGVSICCKPESIAYLDLIWTRKASKADGKRGLTTNQKIVLELVLFSDLRSVDDLAYFFGRRKSNLKKRDIDPLIEMKLIELDKSGALKVDEGFEKTLHEIFVESGGQEELRMVREKFKKDREKYGEEYVDNEIKAKKIEEQFRLAMKGELGFMDLDWEAVYELDRA